MTFATTSCATDPTMGYSTASIYPEDVQTVAVDIFENDTYYRDIEFELADALIKEIQARTPYRLARRDEADSIITGRIRDVSLDRLSKSPQTGLASEIIVGVSVDFEWEDRRREQTLIAREGFTGQGLFTPSRPLGERIELGEFAAVQQLARDMVDQLQAEW